MKTETDLANQMLFNAAWQRAKTPIRAIYISPRTECDLCRYRVDGIGSNTEPENCCFLGVSIAPKDYSRNFEGNNLARIRSTLPAGNILKNADVALCQEIQAVHDNKENKPEDWPDKLRKIAKTYYLKVPE